MTVHRASMTSDEAQRSFHLLARDQLRFDPASGFARWADQPDPVMLVWSPRIYEFLQVLEDVLTHHPARGLVREVGFRSGSEGARTAREAWKAEDGGPLRVLLSMPGVLAGAGWGVSELEYDDGAGWIDWTFPRGTAVGDAARRAGRRTKPACAFYEGFGAGWVKESLDLEVEFFESACVSLQASQCRFRSRPLV